MLRTQGSLNTLTGGHCIRTTTMATASRKATSLNTLTGGHCIRTGAVKGQSSPHFRLNTLTGGHCIRTRASPDWPGRVASLNTLTGGHCIRTRGRPGGAAPHPRSQCPHRWALYSDSTRIASTSCSESSQYPHRWALYSDAGTRVGALRCPGLNTLTGGHCIRTVLPGGRGSATWSVSIPSQVGTVFGQGGAACSS